MCSRTGCSTPAIATLTYVYADSTAVLGPLALRAEPGSYDLCAAHSASLSAPRGWEVIRLPEADIDTGPSTDDLMALARAVRLAGLGAEGPDAPEPAVSRRKGHLAVIADL
ncbi:DUF3499 domain-containing protein [Micropruina sp.]|jgi:hypothetical protein|uniref:DUF3499 domain-containing protein n=1 Tax=Micropruina sp. TaxID=2737536 RepID=UPI00261A63A8|nr:DUF3499 domain-containing protein [Micropruina sp.]